MPFLYYCKNGGTAGASNNGRVDAATPRTGSWNASASDYWAHPEDAISNATTTPVAGDCIVWSRTSAETIGSDTLFTVPEGVHVITVDDANQDTYQKAAAAQIANTDGNRYDMRQPQESPEPMVRHGCHIRSGDDCQTGQGGVRAWWHECTLEYSATGLDIFRWIGSAEDESVFYDVDFLATTTGNHYIETANGSKFVMFGGRHETTSSRCFQAGVRGHAAVCIGRDFSGMPDGCDLIRYTKTADCSGEYLFYRCKLPTNWTVDGVEDHSNQRMVVQSCDSEFQYEVFAREGLVEFVTDVYHNDDDTLKDGSTKGAYEFVTDATHCAPTKPFWLGSVREPRFLVAENTEAATKQKVRVKFASDTALDTNSLVVYVGYPNGTTPHQMDVAAHIPELIKSGSALSTESGKWVGAGVTNQYYLDVPMTSPSNGDVEVFIGITEPNATIYVSPQIDFVA